MTANPVVVEVHGLADIHNLQKERESMSIVVQSDGVLVHGWVKYKYGVASYRHDDVLFVELPVFIAKGKLTATEVAQRYRHTLVSETVKLTFDRVDRADPEPYQRLLARHPHVEVWMIRYHARPLSSVFDIHFRYFQPDILESGMAFNFYVPLFEEGFPENKLPDGFIIRIHDDALLLVSLSMGNRQLVIGGALTEIIPWPGQLIVLSKLRGNP